MAPALWSTVAVFLFTDLFDSLSTLIGVAQASNMLDEDGNPLNLKQGLIVDAFSTLFAGLFGTSSGTAYVESAAGINAGGRTGLTSVFTALCFLPCFFVGPLAGMVPVYATAPVLILIGAAMFKSVATIDFGRLEEGLPAFLTIILIAVTSAPIARAASTDINPIVPQPITSTRSPARTCRGSRAWWGGGARCIPSCTCWPRYPWAC